MKDAIGGSLLLNLVVIFSSVIILFFAGVLAYSKAYKIKNKIIEIVEGYDGRISNGISLNTDVKTAIETELGSVGYMLSSAPSHAKCGNDSARNNCTNLNNGQYYYCICEQSSATNEGVSYEVITYVRFEFPVIGDLLVFPVRGETKVLGKRYNY